MDKYILVRIFLIILACATLFVLVTRYSQQQKVVGAERFYDDINNLIPFASAGTPTASGVAAPKNGGWKAPAQGTQGSFYPASSASPAQDSGRQVQPSEPIADEDYRAVDFSSAQLPNDCFPKDRLTAEDLLPKDQANSRWAQLNPAGQGDVKDQNFLSAGYLVGINTTMGSRTKNANMSIRSEPANPQQVVSPWIQSTILPDLMRRPLEIGESC